jgi:CRISPR-associated endonuclease Csn1
VVSFKAGKKVATNTKRIVWKKVNGKRKKEVVQQNLFVPRGALSKESVYGKIMAIDKDIKTGLPIKYSPKYLFENVQLIVRPKIKALIEERISLHEGNVKAAISSLKKNPIFLDEDKTIELTYGSCYAEKSVLKYAIASLTDKDVPYIVDGKIKQLVKERLLAHKNNAKEAFKEPLLFNNKPILTVRLYTEMEALEVVKKNNDGKPIGFVAPSNNHHVALYKNAEGMLVEHVATFWHCVERKRFFEEFFTKEECSTIQNGTIITKPKLVWNKILERENSKFEQNFLANLPNDDWEFVESIQTNEIFVFGLSKSEILQAIGNNDFTAVAGAAYRVQKISSRDYIFRQAFETKVDNKVNDAKNDQLTVSLGKMIRINSVLAWQKHNPVKVKVGLLGKIELLD